MAREKSDTMASDTEYNQAHPETPEAAIEATAEAVTELERQLKLRDEVVRFKTVRPELRVKKPA